MRLLSWLISLPLFAAIIIFVLQNRVQVTLNFWPLDAQATLPLSLLSLGLLIVGFLLGVFVTGISHYRAKFELYRLRKDLDKAHTARINAEAKSQTPTACEPVILYKGRYQNISPSRPAIPTRKSGWKSWLERK